MSGCESQPSGLGASRGYMAYQEDVSLVPAVDRPTIIDQDNGGCVRESFELCD